MSKGKKITKKRRKSGYPGIKPVLIASVCMLCAVLIAGLVYSRLPGAAEQTQAPQVRISEVVTDSQPLYSLTEASDWIEVENASGEPVNLVGWALLCAADPSNAFVFPNAEIAPGGFVVVYADGSVQQEANGVYHAPFRLPASGGQLVLLNKNGASHDLVNIPELAVNQAYCRDADGVWRKSSSATPGEANRIDAAGQTAVQTAKSVGGGVLEITEVMADNISSYADAQGLYHDYVEIRNTSSAPVSLAGWRLSDDGAKLGKWQFPAGELGAGECLVVHCSGTGRTDDPAHLHAGFRLGGGESVYLTAPDGTLASAVAVPEMNADQSYSLTEAGWTSMAMPTPGRANDQDGADAADAARISANPTGVIITEVVTAGFEAGDWIELYNTSSQPVELAGYGLSDNAGRPRKWQFPEGTTIQPGGYLLVLASGRNTGMETNFSLSADGGYSVVLADPEGSILDAVFVGKQYGDLSYGRRGVQGGVRYFAAMTPGTANGGESWSGRADMPRYSVEGGLYNAGETLTVTISAAPGARIHYTTDYTDPDENSPVYSGPITISGTTILRTRVYQEGMKASFVDTQSYIFDALNGGGSVYVVSVVSDPYNLTSDEAGILVRGTGAKANYMQDWEREAHIEIFDQQGNTLLSENCGVRQQGQTCRAEPQQALKFVARSRYGNSVFEGDLFTKNDFTEWNALLLRPSNDDANKSRMRDSVLSGLAIDTSLLYQETEVCVAYLNGEYWGHYNLREGINTQLICQYEGWEGQEDEIDLVVGNDDVIQGSDQTFEMLMDWLKNNNPNTEEAYRAIDSVIDMENYIEYMCIQIYVGNTDPSNIKRYRNANDDGKWHWIVFDMDWAYNQDTNSISRWLNPGGVGNGKRTDNTFFIACMKNYAFRDRFLTKLGEMMADTLSEEHVLSKFSERYNLLMTIMPDHCERWGTSLSKYNREVRKIADYGATRTDRLLEFIKNDKTLNLSQQQMEHYFGAVMAQQGLTYASLPTA